MSQQRLATVGAAAMPRVLQVPELFDLIIGELDDEDLTIAARVCKQWSEVALGHLWETQTDLRPLFNLLASKGYELKHNKLDLVGLPTERAWHRFFHYSKRVKSLAFDDTDERYVLLLDTFARLRPFHIGENGNLFPSLRSFSWVAPTELSLLHRSVLFMHPGIRTFHITLPTTYTHTVPGAEAGCSFIDTATPHPLLTAVRQSHAALRDSHRRDTIAAEHLQWRRCFVRDHKGMSERPENEWLWAGTKREKKRFYTVVVGAVSISHPSHSFVFQPHSHNTHAHFPTSFTMEGNFDPIVRPTDHSEKDQFLPYRRVITCNPDVLLHCLPVIGILIFLLPIVNGFRAHPSTWNNLARSHNFLRPGCFCSIILGVYCESLVIRINNHPTTNAGIRGKWAAVCRGNDIDNLSSAARANA
ncbi:hypothetical protein NMY22_g20155 [Coprinellus aureogranulatus]|nr:hypothetical protein NMY22_g20155 [Coprinellus aureogranulatus]